MATWETVRELLRQLPGTVEGPPGERHVIRVDGKQIAYTTETARSQPEHFDGDEVLVVRIEFEDRAALIAEDPSRFAVTPHYEGYRGVLVRLPKVPRDVLRELLIDAWLMVAPKRQVREVMAGPPGRVDGVWPPESVAG
jgi:hypothetical protein